MTPEERAECLLRKWCFNLVPLEHRKTLGLPLSPDDIPASELNQDTIHDLAEAIREVVNDALNQAADICEGCFRRAENAAVARNMILALKERQ